MIKNIVFDYGNTLIKFDAPIMVTPYVSDPGEAELIGRAIFANENWKKLDSGEMTNDDFIPTVHERLPRELWEKADRVFSNWIYHLPPIEGMNELVRRIKSDYGVRVFILSNISSYFAEHAHEFPIFSEMEDCVFSALCRMVKPDPEIYRYMCDRFGILPDETVFVDDNRANIESANRLGIHGYLFDGDAEKLGQYLDRVLSES